MGALEETCARGARRAGLFGAREPQQLEERVVEGTANVRRALPWMSAPIRLVEPEQLQRLFGLVRFVDEHEEMIQLHGA
jgi:hypothetical protein